MSRFRTILFVLLGGVALLPLSAVAQGQGEETTHGDVLGDLVHVLRDPQTGQPILQKRWVELTGDAFGWAYCPIPVDAAGAEIPFAPESCDVDPSQLSRLVEVDYFGRLSAGRTKERNQRMHFDETITNIQDAEAVDLEPAGRLMLGTGCEAGGACAAWKVIDSPMENMALYHRLMKYGHIQTDPMEVDNSSGGDPALGTVYHPALRAADWAKFRGGARALLPSGSVGDCFFGDTFNPACAQGRALDAEDFVRGASFLGGASDKTGRTTVDLVQYMNRILKITVTTPDSTATLDTLPVLIRDENGIVAPAMAGMPPPADERVMDFTRAAYWRDERFDRTVPGLVRTGAGTWAENAALPLLPYLEFSNGPATHAENIDAFVRNTGDAQRAIEFVHNYEIPEDLMASPPPAPDTTSPTTSILSPAAGTVSGVVTVTATAADDVALAGVRIQLDGTDLGSEMTVPPFTATWDTTPAVNGSSHAITSIARDTSGNTTTSDPVMVTVSNAPPPVAVPDVVGRLQAVATSAITTAGLTVGTITTQHDAAPAGTVLAQNPSAGTLVDPGSAVALTVSLGPAPVTVPGVVGLTQPAAESAIGAAGLTVGTVTTTNDSAAAGTVIGQNPGAGASVAPGTAVALTVSLGPATTADPAVDAMVFADGLGRRTTPPFSTTGPAVLVALAASDGPGAVNAQTLTISGAGLTWTRVQRAAIRYGVSEIWTATSASALANATVTSAQATGTYYQSLMVVAFTGVSGVGASNVAGASSGAPAVTLVTQGAGSLVFAVGNDWDRAVARTIPAGQTKLHEYFAPLGDTMWMQRANNPIPAAGTPVTLNVTAPTTDQWNFAIVELKR